MFFEIVPSFKKWFRSRFILVKIRSSANVYLDRNQMQMKTGRRNLKHRRTYWLSTRSCTFSSVRFSLKMRFVLKTILVSCSCILVVHHRVVSLYHTINTKTWSRGVRPSGSFIFMKLIYLPPSYHPNNKQTQLEKEHNDYKTDFKNEVTTFDPPEPSLLHAFSVFAKCDLQTHCLLYLLQFLITHK